MKSEGVFSQVCFLFLSCLYSFFFIRFQNLFNPSQTSLILSSMGTEAVMQFQSRGDENEILANSIIFS